MDRMIRTNTGMLRNAGEAALAAIRAAEINTEAINSAGSKLCSMWEGEASNSFKALLDEDIAALYEVCGELRRIAEAETGAASSYEQCEMKVIEEASAVM